MSELDRLDTLRLRFADQPMRFGVSYAEALRRAGRLEDAVAVLRTAMEEGSRNVLGLGILARCLRDLGHPEEAGIAVRTALDLDPDDPVASELAYLVTFAPAQREGAPSEEAIAIEEAPVVRWDEPPRAPEPIAEEEPTGAPEPLGERAPAPPPEPMPSVFVTQTMAELYVQQGLPERAVAIYRELTMRAPNDTSLAVRLGEVIALAANGAAEVEEAEDGLGELPLLDDFDPIAMVEPMPEAAVDASAPERSGDGAAISSAFDFSEDAHRVAPMLSAADESMLAGLSFEAISLPTPAPDGAGLDLPVGAGPSAREALRQLAHRPVVTRAPRRPPVVSPAPRPTARRTGTVPSSRAGAPPPADPTGDDFDQWLRGVS